MKLVQINVADFGSTGAIVKCIDRLAISRGAESYAFVGRKKGSEAEIVQITGKAGTMVHGALARVGANGHGSMFATKKLIARLREIEPDMIIMHNIHGYYLNIGMFFKYLKSLSGVKITWVLHDCWAFTGGCVYYTDFGCTRWMNGADGCENCPVHAKTYPISYIDTSKREFFHKKELFSDVPGMTVVTPSEWMANEAKKSFLSTYPIKVIKNGVNLDVFKSSSAAEISLVTKKYNIPDKPYVLGVSSVWETRKQPEIFAALAEAADDFNVVMVGLNEKKQAMISAISEKVIFVPRTESKEELAALYSGALAMINPSLDDTFPFTVLESLASGTPVINSCSGGCPEQVDENTGFVLKNVRDIREISDKIRAVSDAKKAASFAFSKEACRSRAESLFNENQMAESYLFQPSTLPTSDVSGTT